MYAIVKDIPLPARKGGLTDSLTETLRQLDVGDSFVIPERPSIRSSLCVIAGRLSIKVACRKTPDGLRVWRTE